MVDQSDASAAAFVQDVAANEHARKAALAGDPTNQWLTNFPRQRLSAEALRDTLMKVSGKLDLVPGGAHSFPPMAEWHVTQHHPFRGGCDHERRGVYLIN